MKRSERITLILIASTTLVACGPDVQEARREIYESKEKCVQDWGDEENCEDTGTGGTYRGPRYFYTRGYPYYYPPRTHDPAPVRRDAGFAKIGEGAKSPRSLGSISSPVINRGGFGKSAFFHGAGS